MKNFFYFVNSFNSNLYYRRYTTYRQNNFIKIIEQLAQFQGLTDIEITIQILTYYTTEKIKRLFTL